MFSDTSNGLVWAAIAQSVLRLVKGWTVRGSNPTGGGVIFRTLPDRPWGPPSHLYDGCRVSQTGVKRPGCAVNHTPPSAEVEEKVELYLHYPSGPAWLVLVWTLHFISYFLWAAGFEATQLSVGVVNFMLGTRGRSGIRGGPGERNNLAPPQSLYYLKFFALGQGWRTFLRAHAQTTDNFLGNSFACGGLSRLSPNVRLFQSRHTARYRLAPRAAARLAWPLVRPSVAKTSMLFGILPINLFVFVNCRCSAQNMTG